MNSASKSALFTSVQLGALSLKHRVIMAPLTRSRSIQPDSIPGPLMQEYYGQRVSEGGLIIGEATNISLASRGWLGAPGLYTTDQTEGWKKIVQTVHRGGGLMLAQLWHTGRSSHVSLTGGAQPVSASVNPAYWQHSDHLTSTLDGWVAPSPHRSLTIREIAGVVEDYRLAAQNAMTAEFDGVELHAGNGYLVDQFLQDSSNKRTDEYGGDIPNRARFLLEVVNAMISVWGADRVAVRTAPGGTWNDMSDSNSDDLFAYVAEQLNALKIAYLHVIEPRVQGHIVIHEGQGPIASEALGKIFNGPIVSAGGFEPDSAEEAVRLGISSAVTFGRHFISNPDLPYRIREGLPLAEYDRNTFYTFDAKGYTDYPAYAEALASDERPAH